MWINALRHEILMKPALGAELTTPFSCVFHAVRGFCPAHFHASEAHLTLR